MNNLKKLKEMNLEDFEMDVDHRMGMGSTGGVYPVIDHPNIVVKKIIADSPEKKLSIQKEFEILDNLDHPNLIQAIGYDSKQLDKTTTAYYLYMERAKSNLREFIDQNKDYFSNIDNYLQFMVQMIKIGEYFESHKFAHRDVKPGNILVFDSLSDSYVYKWGDTSYAKQIQSIRTIKANTIVGTLGYWAPEISKGYVDVGEKLNYNLCDVYSLGVVLLEIVGFPPTKLQEFADIKVAKQRDAKIRELALEQSRIFETKWILEQLVMMVQLEPKNRPNFSVIAKNIISNVGLLKSWANLSICRKGLDLETSIAKMKSKNQGGLIAKVNCCHMLYKCTLDVEKWAVEMFAGQSKFQCEDHFEKVGQWSSYLPNINGVAYEEYEHTIEYFQKIADKGYSFALSAIGNVYRIQGKYKKAIEYYQKAADKGHKYALNYIGDVYEDKKNYEKAIEYYQKEAEKGVSDALFKMGNVYENQKNYEKAFEYYQRASDKGDKYALYNTRNAVFLLRFCKYFIYIHLKYVL